jgi:hypothetical protein
MGKLLDWRSWYNGFIGIDRTILYVRPALLRHYMAEPRIQRLVRQGQLVLVDWDLPIDGYRSCAYFDQNIVLNHGSLSFWGRRTWLWMGDLDEFFSTVRGATLPQMLELGCLSNYTGCLSFPVHDVHLAGPPGTNEASTWRNSEDNPVVRYKIRTITPKSTYKTLLDPNTAIGVYVHTAYSCAGKGAVVGNATQRVVASQCGVLHGCHGVATQCAWVAHVPNMFTRRKIDHNATDSVRETRWLWMFEANEG